MTPIVTVLTTVRNGEDFIEDCVNSILAQTLKGFEYIILDNGSTDRTAGILDRFADPRLKIVHQEDLGISASLNKGVNLSRCDLIARLDADDYCFPSRLERQVELMNQHSDVVLCGARFLELTNGKLSQQRVPFVETDQAIRKSLSCFNPFAHSAVMFRKKTFLAAGGYSEQLKYSQDYDLWLQMLGFGETCILKEDLVVVRVSEQSESHKNAREQQLEGLQIRWNAFQRFGGKPGEALYYFLKSLAGLIFPSKNHLNH